MESCCSADAGTPGDEVADLSSARTTEVLDVGKLNGGEPMAAVAADEKALRC